MGSTFITFIIHLLTVSLQVPYHLPQRTVLRMCKLHVSFNSNSEPKALPSSWGHRAAGTASLARLCGPAGALCLQGCLDCSCGCVLLCLTHKSLLDTIHGKKNYLRVAFCLAIAKSCPQPDPTSPAWGSLLPLRLPKAGSAPLQGPWYC